MKTMKTKMLAFGVSLAVSGPVFAEGKNFCGKGGREHDYLVI